METNKINEQNKYLLNQVTTAEKHLRNYLMSHDKTEFAQENSE